MVYKPRRERARGGKAEDGDPKPEMGHLYNAKGSPEEKEIDEKSDGFKRGGKLKKRKEGGKVEGMHAKHHLGKRARGGATEHEEKRREEKREEEDRPERARGGRTEKPMMRGGSPFSAAHKTTAPGNEKDGPGEQAPVIP